MLPTQFRRTDNDAYPCVRKPIGFVVVAILYPLAVVGLMALADVLFWDVPFEGEALLIAFFASNVVMNALLIYYRHKGRDRWINAEATKWLERRSRHKETHKAARLLFWLPSIAALWVLLLLPFATHLIHLHLITYRNTAYRFRGLGLLCQCVSGICVGSMPSSAATEGAGLE